MKKICFLLFLIIGGLLSAQITLVITSLPDNTPSDSTIYVAGTFNNWNPATDKMISDGKGNLVFTIPEASGTVEFKFTRGSWDTVEGSKNGGFFPNRTFKFIGKPQTIYLTIENWEDINRPKSTAAVNVRILDDEFYIPQLKQNRRIWLYLPPDYNSTDKTYPVLYMHDGQNIFDDTTSYAGEWQVDETLNKLFSEGDYGAIVVGVDNGEADRIAEYTPWSNAKYGGGAGELYMEFIAETLKPYIDKNFRTKPEAKYNALIGSSLGALISTYGAVKYSEQFKKTGSLSPAYWIVMDELENYIRSSTVDLSDMRIYFAAGENEYSNITTDIETIKAVLIEKGLKPENIFLEMNPDGQHNEGYWSQEFGRLYQWLFEERR